MANYRALSSIFVVLTVIFAVTTGYFYANPNTVTQTSTTTQVSTSLQTLTVSTTGGSSSGVNISRFTVGIGISSNSSIGTYLTSDAGFTLYKFLVDKPNNGTSACYGQCATAWPAFDAGSVKTPPGINASSFSTITRKDGSKQTTYNGWPLYFFSKDKQAGDIFGQGLGKVWFAYSVPSSGTASSTIPAYTIAIAAGTG